MKVAILIGISEYNSQIDLPGCVKDLQAMKTLIEESKEYEEIKFFEKNVTGQKLKSSLSDFFVKLKNESVDEIFFYFTGHGLNQNEEFYHVLSDFDENNLSQTTLENSELDQMIKSVNPELVVKIIDACQSGVSYIKGNGRNAAKSYHKSTLNQFKKCYFFQSSMSNQYSYQNEVLSLFTGSFLHAVIGSDKSEIRYKHLIDYVSDDFRKNDLQTPYFVTQADYTEIFINYTDEIEAALLPLLLEKDSIKIEIESNGDEKPKLLSDLIKENAKIYTSEEEMVDILLDIELQLEGKNVTKEISEVYSKTVTRVKIKELPKGNEIGAWLVDNADYFAEPTYINEYYEVEEPFHDIYAFSYQDRMKTKKVTKTRKKIDSYSVTTQVPFECLFVDLVPIYPNLDHYVLILAFIVSKKDLKIFYTYSKYGHKNWKTLYLIQNVTWNEGNFILKDHDGVSKFLNEQFDIFNEIIYKAVKKKFE